MWFYPVLDEDLSINPKERTIANLCYIREDELFKTMLINHIKVVPHQPLEAPHPWMMLFSMSQEPHRWLLGTRHRLQLNKHFS